MMRSPEESYPDGEQLELWPGLFPRLPWEGRSPRALTRGSKVVILQAQAGRGHERFIADREQCEMVLGDRAPLLRRGAPLLLPFLDGGL